MIKKLVALSFSLLMFMSCETPKQFTAEVLEETMIDLSGKEHGFDQVLEQYKGKKVLIDVWASWCGDCIKNFPKVKQLQEEYPEVVFLFLSEDRTQDSWKKTIERHKLKGEHYYIKSKSKGAFKDFLNSNWIPRYMVLDANSNIALFKAKTATDKRIKEALQ